MFAMKDIEHAVNNEEFDKCVGQSCELERKTLCPNDKLEKAFDIMIEDDVHSICITDPKNGNRLLGIISKTDIMRTMDSIACTVISITLMGNSPNLVVILPSKIHSITTVL